MGTVRLFEYCQRPEVFSARRGNQRPAHKPVTQTVRRTLAKQVSSMQNNNQSQQIEDVILEYPYKPFGHLKITTTQLIFKKVFLGFNTFSGVINISDLVEVKYLNGASVFGVPGLEIVYRSSNNQTAKVRINFPSTSGRLGMELRSGVTPEKVFETILSLKGNSK